MITTLIDLENMKLMANSMLDKAREQALISFITESNKIEGINRPPTEIEIKAHNTLIACKKPTIDDVIAFVSACEPTAKIRDKKGMNVRVGSSVPIEGGVIVESILSDMIENSIDLPTISLLEFHQRYEKLHPFMDCNGRSGRALWYWQMVNLNNRWPDKFLQEYYYQTLGEL